MPPQPHDPTPDSATEHAAIYIVALVFTDSGHLRTTLVVTPLSSVRGGQWLPLDRRQRTTTRGVVRWRGRYL